MSMLPMKKCKQCGNVFSWSVSAGKPSCPECGSTKVKTYSETDSAKDMLKKVKRS